ncbi:hypothetical protein [Pseudomonas brassicae]
MNRSPRHLIAATAVLLGTPTPWLPTATPTSTTPWPRPTRPSCVCST